MCLITCFFIRDVKYYLGSLGFNKKNINEFSLENLQQYLQEKLFFLKNFDDAFSVNCSYQWIERHHKKIIKAINHDKWKTDTSRFYPKKVKFLEEKQNDFYATNMFSKNTVFYKLGQDGTACQVHYNQLNIINKFDFVIDNESKDDYDSLYIFTKEYLQTLKNKKQADKRKAVAVIQMSLIYYKISKPQFLAYIKNIKDKDNIDEIMFIIEKQIKKAIKMTKEKNSKFGNLAILSYLFRIK